MKKIAIAILVMLMGLCAVGFSACNDNGKDPTDGTETEAKAEVIQLSESVKTLDRYEKFVLTAEVKDENGERLDLSVTWASSQPGVASVSDGEVMAQGVGETTITATCGGVSASCKVTVEDSGALPVLSLEDKHLDLLVQGEYDIVASVMYKRLEQTDATFVYEIDDPAIAEVSSIGKITTKACGNATITVTANWRGVQTAALTADLTITVKEDVSVTISSETTTAYIASVEVEGQKFSNTLQFEGEVLLNGSADGINSAAFSWSSSDTDVATIDNDGLMTTCGIEGTTDIKLTYTADSGVYTSAPVTVTVYYPTIDKTDEDPMDLESDLKTLSAQLTGESVFGDSAKAITGVYLDDNNTVNIYQDDDWLTEHDIGTETDRTFTLRIYNAQYAYRMNIFVCTKVIRTAAELANLLDYATDVAEVTSTYNNNTWKTHSYNGYFVLGGNLKATGAEDPIAGPVLGEAGGNPVRNGIQSFAQIQDSEHGQAYGNMGFHGTFDGRGFTVDGFTYGIGGVFGAIGSGAVIKNVAFTNCIVDHDSDSNTRHGGVLSQFAHGGAGRMTIDNVYVQGLFDSVWGGMLTGNYAHNGTISNTVVQFESLGGWNNGAISADTGALAVENVVLVYLREQGTRISDYMPFGKGLTIKPNSGSLAEYELQADGTIKKILEKTANGAHVASITLAETVASADEFAKFSDEYWTIEAGKPPVFKTQA